MVSCSSLVFLKQTVDHTLPIGLPCVRPVCEQKYLCTYTVGLSHGCIRSLSHSAHSSDCLCALTLVCDLMARLLSLQESGSHCFPGLSGPRRPWMQTRFLQALAHIFRAPRTQVDMVGGADAFTSWLHPISCNVGLYPSCHPP